MRVISAWLSWRVPGASSVCVCVCVCVCCVHVCHVAVGLPTSAGLRLLCPGSHETFDKSQHLSSPALSGGGEGRAGNFLLQDNEDKGPALRLGLGLWVPGNKFSRILEPAQ